MTDKVTISPGYSDAAAFFATMLSRQFPELDMQIVKITGAPHRPCLKIILPTHSGYTIKSVDKVCMLLLQQIYSMSQCQYFVAYTIEREHNDSDSESFSADM